MSYNGWTNWETWQVVNWFDTSLDEMANKADSESELVDMIEAFVREEIYEHTPDGGIHMDVMNGFLDEVDFHDLAETMWSDRSDKKSDWLETCERCGDAFNPDKESGTTVEEVGDDGLTYINHICESCKEGN